MTQQPIEPASNATRKTVPDIVGIRFELAGEVHYCDPSGLDLSVGDRVSVDTDEGEREGHVAIAPGQVIHSDLRGPMDPVLRKIEE